MLLLWASNRFEAERLRRCAEAQRGLQLQGHVERLVCLRWAERSLAFQQTEQRLSCLGACVSHWRSAGLREAAQRRRHRGGVAQIYLDPRCLRAVWAGVDRYQNVPHI